MKKSKSGLKKLIYVLIGVVVLLAAMAIFIGMTMKKEQAKMKQLETRELMPDIYAIRSGISNLYLVKTEDKYIVFDAGRDEQATKTALEKLNINGDDIAAVFLTHSDGDHIASTGLFPKATVYLPKEEEQMIDGTTARAFMTRNKFASSYETVDDGEAIALLNRNIKGILTPGHTKGSMCFLLDGKYLFAGDTLSIQNGQIELFNSFYNMDDDEQKESLKKLSKLEGVEAVFTGHYGYLENFEAAIEKWKE